MEEKKCCRTCRFLIEYPKNNRYNDIDYLCCKTGYFCTGIDKDIAKYQRYSPGGRLLNCNWEPKKSTVEGG